MFLRSLAIKNYRSLEHVQLEKLGGFNVLIGRNNSGKSSIFGALALLNKALVHEESDTTHTVLTDQDRNRRLEIHLVFEPGPQEREEFIDSLRGEAPQGRREAMLASRLLSKVEYSFTTLPGSPASVYLREMKLLAEDNNWTVVHGVEEEDSSSTPPSTYMKLTKVSESYPQEPLNSNLLDINKSTHLVERKSPGEASYRDPAMQWLSRQCAKYLNNAFFFSPFRRSTKWAQVQSVFQLNQDGSNLAQGPAFVATYPKNGVAERHAHDPNGPFFTKSCC
jgi:energy-coupling factor transporter ATP-binding protein EcfA2